MKPSFKKIYKFPGCWSANTPECVISLALVRLGVIRLREIGIDHAQEQDVEIRTFTHIPSKPIDISNCMRDTIDKNGPDQALRAILRKAERHIKGNI